MGLRIEHLHLRNGEHGQCMAFHIVKVTISAADNLKKQWGFGWTILSLTAGSVNKPKDVFQNILISKRASRIIHVDSCRTFECEQLIALTLQVRVCVRVLWSVGHVCERGEDF